MAGLVPGKRLVVNIEDFSVKGDGKAFIGDFPVLVPFSIPGDRLKVKVIEVKKTYAKAEIEEIIEPSPHRVPAPCEHFGACGSCPWQMIDYRAQLEFKQNLLRKLLAEMIGREVPLNEIKGMDKPWNFRNKGQYPVKKLKNGQVIIGFYKRGTHRLVNINQCPVEYHLLNKLIKPIKELLGRERITIYDEKRHWGKLRYIVTRGSKRMGEVIIVLVVRMQAISVKLARKIVNIDPVHIVGIVENFNSEPGNVVLGEKFKKIWGTEFYKEKVLGRTFRVSAGSFFQSNVEQLEVLISELRKHFGESRYFLDLYSGVGTFSIILADLARKIVGVEESPSAHSDAVTNANINDMVHVEFIEGKVEGVLMSLGKPDTVLLDPPRSGLHEDVLPQLNYIKPKRIFYVSCNPHSFLRDALRLMEIGYELEFISPYDFFPHTPHVELLSYFTLKV